jgi:hypothetical protein
MINQSLNLIKDSIASVNQKSETSEIRINQLCELFNRNQKIKAFESGDSSTPQPPLISARNIKSNSTSSEIRNPHSDFTGLNALAKFSGNPGEIFDDWLFTYVNAVRNADMTDHKCLTTMPIYLLKDALYQNR